MLNRDIIAESLSKNRESFYGISDRIWDKPELGFLETHAVAEHTAKLEEEGFRVTRNYCGMSTSVMGEFGEGGPVIAILGEYDALPTLSQQAGVAEPMPVEAGANGHGCGHNLLGAGALFAAVVLKDWLEANKLPGRVRYLGCPAEEGGAGKAFMVREGAFHDVDVAMCWHPNAFTAINKPISLANMRVDFTFTGKASHAASSPHLGRSALDAVGLMNIGANYLREQILSTSRLHYAYLDTGGFAPNVVQATAKVRYLMRARELDDLFDLIERVRKLADGAAIMTDTTVEQSVVSAVANFVGNETLDRVVQANMERLGAPPFDAADIATARKFQATFSARDIATAFGRFALEPEDGLALADEIVPFYSGKGDFVGSTDLATVSWVVPTTYLRASTYAIGTPGHSWQLVAQGKLPAAHKGMEHAARILAESAVDLYQRPEMIRHAKEELRSRLIGKTFRNPLPDDVVPTPLG